MLPPQESRQHNFHKPGLSNYFKPSHHFVDCNIIVIYLPALKSVCDLLRRFPPVDPCARLLPGRRHRQAEQPQQGGEGGQARPGMTLRSVN